VRIGAYDVLGELGRGGMGTVYRARGPDGHDVAVKLLARKDAQATSRFARERRLLASFGEAEGFVPLLDSGSHDAGAFLVMPFVPGGTLRARLARGALDVDDVVELGRALAAALGNAHSKGIVHRDVKPENVLFTADGKPLLADLGLAKHFDPDASGASQSVSLSRDGALIGTAGYMAPEQMGNAKTVGPAADVFSLGAVLYECLTGDPAFGGDSGIDVLAKVQRGRFEPLRPRRPETPAWLVATIERALARDPGSRFPDGLALLAALRGPAGRRGGRALAVLGAALVVLAGGAGFALLPRAGTSEVPGHTEKRPTRETPPPRHDDPAAAFLASARAKVEARDYPGVIADLSRAIELDPKLASAWSDRSAARYRTRELEAALADATHAIELDPRLEVAWAARAAIRYDKSDYPGAKEDATHAIELSPNLEAAWLARGKACDALEDQESAIADLTRAIELRGDDAEAWAYRGHARGAKGDNPGALVDASRAVELDPRYAYAWAVRGGARFATGDRAGALADEGRAIELDPSLNLSWLIRAAIHEEANDVPEAIKDFERFLELSPRDVLAPVIRQKIEALRARR
jgi:tetratricopeptide (TPR) repeat protein